jgi:hypothetical protein
MKAQHRPNTAFGTTAIELRGIDIQRIMKHLGSAAQKNSVKP